MARPRTRRAVVPFSIGVATLAALVVAVDPRAVGGAIRHFSIAAVPAVLVLSLSYYLLQGIRWHFLLRAVGVPIRLRDTVTLNLAGQSTGLLPLGELTRALLVCEATGAELGSVVATVTVQELIYTLILIAAALPGSLGNHAVAGAVAAALAATLGVFAILTVPPLFRTVRALVARTPLLRRFRHDVDRLQGDTVVLLRRWDTFTWSLLGAAGAAVSITLFWLVADSIAPGVVSWRGAAFVYAVSHVAGAISLIPGGLGAYEASTVALLVAAGVDLGAATAVAVVHRLADKGLNTVAGVAAYVLARRRLRLGGLGSVLARQAAISDPGDGGGHGSDQSVGSRT